MTNPSPTKDLTIRMPAPDPTSDAEFVASLVSISKSTRAFLAILLVEIGLHPGQDQLLERLRFGEPISVSVLAEQLAVRPSTVSKMLDRLIEKGYVRRINSEGDARRTMVLLTEGGEEMREQIRGVWQRLESEIVNAVPGDERAALTAALSRVEGILVQRLRRLR